MHKLTEKRGGKREGAGRKVDTFRTLLYLAYAKGYGVGITRARAIVREIREKIHLRAIAKAPDGKKILAERMDEYVKRRLEEGFDGEYEVKR
jgi:hypothetical protein